MSEEVKSSIESIVAEINKGKDEIIAQYSKSDLYEMMDLALLSKADRIYRGENSRKLIVIFEDLTDLLKYLNQVQDQEIRLGFIDEGGSWAFNGESTISYKFDMTVDGKNVGVLVLEMSNL